jgi:FkbM family methyltransferase
MFPKRLATIKHRSIVAAKKLWYFKRGESLDYGKLSVRYVPGTRPVREKYAQSDDPVARNDARQLQFVSASVSKGDVVLDIGAHFGEYAVLLGAAVGPSGRVISFEPDKAARDVLGRNLRLNGFEERVTVEPYAVFDSAGRHDFFSRNADGMSALVREGLGTNAHADDVESTTIDTVILDEHLRARNIGVPALAKIDIEGAEINALRGAPTLLRTVKVIVCELHPYAWGEFGTDYSELLQLVRAAGRDIRYLDETRRIEDGPVYGAVIIS